MKIYKGNRGQLSYSPAYLALGRIDHEENEQWIENENMNWVVPFFSQYKDTLSN